MSSMATQRVQALNKRMFYIAQQLAETHPDSPAAEEMSREVDEIQAEQAKLMPLLFAELPWFFRVFFWCSTKFGELTRPFFRAGYRLYHMAKGLM